MRFHRPPRPIGWTRNGRPRLSVPPVPVRRGCGATAPADVSRRRPPPRAWPYCPDQGVRPVFRSSAWMSLFEFRRRKSTPRRPRWRRVRRQRLLQFRRAEDRTAPRRSPCDVARRRQSSPPFLPLPPRRPEAYAAGRVAELGVGRPPAGLGNLIRGVTQLVLAQSGFEHAACKKFVRRRCPLVRCAPSAPET